MMLAGKITKINKRTNPLQGGTKIFISNWIKVKYCVKNSQWLIIHKTQLLNSLLLHWFWTLEEIKKPLWAPGELEPAIDFACRKLGFSASEWNTIMKAPPLPHSHYPSDWAFHKKFHPMYQFLRRMATGRKINHAL